MYIRVYIILLFLVFSVSSNRDHPNKLWLDRHIIGSWKVIAYLYDSNHEDSKSKIESTNIDYYFFKNREGFIVKNSNIIERFAWKVDKEILTIKSLNKNQRKDIAFKLGFYKDIPHKLIFFERNENLNIQIILNKNLSLELYNSIINNDKERIMDSCYSGAEEGGNNLLISDNADNAFKQVGIYGSNKEVKERLRYRKNVLRIYSSLANQQSREGNYKQIKGMQVHLGSTYNFLKQLGYTGVGNGMFSITLAAFFADIDTNKNAYSFEDLNSHINLKISALQESGFDSQRPKMTPFQSPFKAKEKLLSVLQKYRKKKTTQNRKTIL
jgi:hypothetical protein